MVAIRRLGGVKFGERERKILNDFRREMRGRPYEENMLDLVRAAHDYDGEVTSEDLSSLFCSELVAEAFQRMGLLTDDKASDEYTPGDFGAHADLMLRRGFPGKEFYLA